MTILPIAPGTPSAVAAEPSLPLPLFVSTAAGMWHSGDGGPATAAPISPGKLLVDPAGNVLFTAYGGSIRRMTPSGIISTIAGNGPGYAGDGGPAVAALMSPVAIARDSLGNLFVSETDYSGGNVTNNRVRKIATSGIITTIAGTGEADFSGDGGPAVAAKLRRPNGIAVDPAGNLFIADTGNQRIRKIDTTGVITTVAGGGAWGNWGNGGPATAASLDSPMGVAVDGNGNLFISENTQVRKVDSSGIITLVAGRQGHRGFAGDGGPALSAQLWGVEDVAVDATGNIYLADTRNGRVRRIDPTGTITTVAGSNVFGFSGDGGPATSATLALPSGVAIAPDGSLYIADRPNQRVRRVDTTGIISTIAGSGFLSYYGDGGPALEAALYSPEGVAVDAAGNRYIADTRNHRIRRIDAAGTITTVAGTGDEGYSGDGGPATAARLRHPSAVGVDAAGNVYLADSWNNRVRRITADGIIATVAGTGTWGFSGDGGPATSAEIGVADGMAVDGTGNVYIAFSENHRVRKIDATGIISTIAGTGAAGFSGDGGLASAAKLRGPASLVSDAAGNVYIADSGNRRVRKVTPGGTITTVAGNGDTASGFSGDGGPATSAALTNPRGLALRPDGTLYVGSGSRIRSVAPTGRIATVAGTGAVGFSGGEGVALDVRMSVDDIAVDPSGSLYVADSTNQRVWILDESYRLMSDLFGERRSSGYAEDPVNTATGNFTTTTTDLDFPDTVFGLAWSRTYNSLDRNGSALGPRWTAGFGSHVVAGDGAEVTLVSDDGHTTSLTPVLPLTTPLVYGRAEELFGVLSEAPDGGWRLAFDDGRVDVFGADGRLVSRSNWDSQHVDLAYDTDGRLAAATHSSGRALSFAYDGARLLAVTADDGRAVTYMYDDEGFLEAAIAPFDASAVVGGALGDVNPAGVLPGSGPVLNQVAGPLTFYDVDDAGRILRIIDPDGVTVVVNEYDSAGRVKRQEGPSGKGVLFSYEGLHFTGNGVTTVTDEASGSVTRYRHDAMGRLTSITDAHGAVMTKSYDAVGNLVAQTDRRGATQAQTFDAHGNVLTRPGPLGVIESFAYDGADRLTSATDGAGKTTTFAYDGTNRVPHTVTDPTGAATVYEQSGGLVTAVTDADDVTTAFAWSAARNLTSSTDDAGRTTTFGYDSRGNRTSSTTPLGRTTKTAWDSARRVLSATDPTGAVVSQTWTAAGRLATRTDAAGKTTALAYDDAGRLATETDPLGHVTTFGYDADSNLTTTTRPGGATTTATFDPLGRKLTETSPTGVTTTFGHDADGNSTTTTNAAGKTTTRVYDARGRLTTETDPLGHATTYAYDNADRPTSTTDATGIVRATTYDAAGRVLTSSEPPTGVTTVAYTPAGRVASRTDGNGHVTTSAYDSRGRLEEEQDPLGGRTDYAWDDDGRLTSVTSPGGLVTTYGYDAAGRVTTVGDPASGTTTRRFTARGELEAIIDATGGVQHFAYDAVGNLTRTTDANGHVTNFGYDARGNRTGRSDEVGTESFTFDLADRPTGATDELGRTTTWAYDPVGRLSAVNDPSGRSATFAYDDADRLVKRTFGDGSTVVLAYDDAGRRTSMTDATGTSTWAWSGGRLASTTNGGGKTLAFSYDPGGRRTGVTYPDGTTATSGWDDADRLVSVGHPAGGATSYGYDADGRVLAESLPDSVTRAYAYQAGTGRLTGYSETRGTTTRSTTLAYDAAGRVTAENTDGQAAAYRYDAAGQLTTAIRGLDITAYTYDVRGNRTAKAQGAVLTRYTYDAAGQLGTASRKAGGVTLETVTADHDGAGRLTQLAGPARSEAYGFDAKGALATVTDTRPGAVRTTTRATDGDGTLRGLSTVEPLGATHSAHLTWDTATAVPQIATATTAGADVNLVNGVGRAFAVRGGQADVFAHDAHGSTLALGDTADLARSAAYDEFGKAADGPATSLFDEVAGTTATGAGDVSALFGYRGELTVNGLVNLRARDYATGLGRFTTVDPLDGVPGETTVTNPYHYANNDPLNQVDPLGLRPLTDLDLRNPLTGLTWSEFERFQDCVVNAYTGSSWSSGCAALRLTVTTRRDVILFEARWATSINGKYASRQGEPLPPGYSGWSDAERLEWLRSQNLMTTKTLGDMVVAWSIGTKLGGLRGATADDTIVLGKYPDYLKLADDLGARVFNVPKDIWKTMSVAQQWEANRAFLDEAIALGSEIRLASSALPIDTLTGYYAQEINYLLKQGYTVSKDGLRLIPPGR